MTNLTILMFQLLSLVNSIFNINNTNNTVTSTDVLSFNLLSASEVY